MYTYLTNPRVVEPDIRLPLVQHRFRRQSNKNIIRVAITCRIDALAYDTSQTIRRSSRTQISVLRRRCVSSSLARESNESVDLALPVIQLRFDVQCFGHHDPINRRWTTATTAVSSTRTRTTVTAPTAYSRHDNAIGTRKKKLRSIKRMNSVDKTDEKRS
jgi:hypothetical protein